MSVKFFTRYTYTDMFEAATNSQAESEFQTLLKNILLAFLPVLQLYQKIYNYNINYII